jgi:hypothetical protein
MSLPQARTLAILMTAAAFALPSLALAQPSPRPEAEPGREPPPQPRPEPPPPPPAPIAPDRVSETMQFVLDTYSEFQRARDDCDREAMAAALRRLLSLVLSTDEEADEVEAELGDGSPIPDGRFRRLDRVRRERDATRSLYEQARRELPRNCPGPPIPAPGRPGHGPAYYASLGGAWLNDGDLDLGLAQATLAVDFSLGGDDDTRPDDASGLGNARLGPRFRLLGEVSAGFLDQSHEAGGFRDSVGLRWSAIGLAGLALPLGDAGAGSPEAGFLVFGGAGYGFARFGFALEGPGVDFRDGDTADFFAFGAGAEVRLDRRNGLRAAYTRWDDFEEDGISANVFSLSYVRRFGGGGGR